jgi:dephospho-CoA kinase
VIFQRQPGGHADDADTIAATPPVLIGLTGPIGCGKSTVAWMLAEVGGTIVDADELTRRVTERGSPALPEIRARFGDVVFSSTGDIDRAALARLVFSDAQALSDLERIVHPRVRPLVEERLAAVAADGAPFIVVEAIKLVEGGLSDRCDEVWLVECTPVTQRSRLAERGSSEQDMDQRIAAQGADLLTRLERQLADRAVRTRRLSTEGSLEQTRERVEDALADLLDRPVGEPPPEN